MVRKTREEKAITLIALIITIVVLLILAVVAINAVTGDGIIQHATNAKIEYEEAQREEEKMLEYYTGVLETGKVVPTVEQLEEKYKFEYYASFKDAIEKVNGSAVQTVNKENAIAGIYIDEDNLSNVVLLQNTTENARITPTTNMNINLGGNILTVTNDTIGIDGTIESTDVITIDGQLKGSGITVENTDKISRVFQIRTGTVNVIGGIYNSSSINNEAHGVFSGGGTLNISNCVINVSSENSRAKGIDNQGTLNITNCKIFADSKSREVLVSDSRGLQNFGTATINSCYVYGNYCGLQTGNSSKTYVVGGTFEAVERGGALFTQGGEGEVYISGAKISCVDYKGKYNDYEGMNLAEFQYGAFSLANNNDMSIYIDECIFTGGKDAFILEGENNEVYISNSTIGNNQIRIDNDTLKLFIGKGCNFTADNTDRSSSVTSVPDAVYTK